MAANLLKFIRPPSVVSAGIPPNVTTLGVSWLNGRFHALAVHRGQVEGAWSSPAPQDGIEHFEPLLREAVKQTGFKGATVSLVLGHRQLIHQLEEMPAAKGAALTKLIQRRAQQQQFFPGAAAWCYQPVVSSKGTPRVLLNLFPKILLDQLGRACGKLDLFLTAVVPPVAILHDQLPQLPGSSDETVLLAAETAGTTSVIVGRRDGKLFLARTLPGNWNANAGALAVDLKRTLLFVNQQFGETVGSVWLFGAGAAEQQAAVQAQMEPSVKLSPVPFSEAYWATELLRVPAGPGVNFISREQQRAPQKRVLGKVLFAATAVLVLGSAGMSAKLWLDRRRELHSMTDLRKHEAELQTKHTELQQLHAELERRQQFVSTVADGRMPPVPVWFMAYLSEAVPSELVVTNLQVRRAGPVWKVDFSGVLQGGLARRDAQVLDASLNVLTNRLVTGPFHVQLGALGETLTAAKAESGTAALASWVAKLASNPTPAAKAAPQQSFHLEGVMP